MTAPTDPFGYLLVHFVEDAHGHAEKIYLSLSLGDDPLRWRRLHGGEAVLESTAGTTGVRDPHLVRRHDGTGFHVIATDLRVWTDVEPDWDAFQRHGSRDLVIWDSPDLLTWSAPRYVTVAPPSAGMAWAPEAHHDAELDTYLVYWSSKVYEGDDVEHAGESHSRIMVARTQDFVTFGEPETYLDLGTGVIDMTVHVEELAEGGVRVHRLAKQDDAAPGSAQVFHEVGSGFLADDFVRVASNVGQSFASHVEAPLVFRANAADGTGARPWFLWVDRYGEDGQGYRALTSRDIASGEWEPVVGLELPEHTKHGTVLPLLRAEWERLDSAL